MKFTKPNANDSFTITAVPEWPSIAFETDATGAHTWTWKIVWGTYSKTGKQTTTGNTWDAKTAVTNLGGTLTVTAEAGKEKATITVKLIGTNPSATEVNTYLGTKANSAGFDKIIAHESKYKHFKEKTHEPVKSFDNGYGMCQLTSPKPTFEQVWNWKQNIDAGLKLFEVKRTAAITYLTQSGRTYTADQLKYETVCRWNGGAYHTWDATAKKWVRNANILCDTKTGNIGWDMTKTENAGKTEADLRKRDMGEYAKPPKTRSWGYFGVCYADRILG